MLKRLLTCLLICGHIILYCQELKDSSSIHVRSYLDSSKYYLDTDLVRSKLFVDKGKYLISELTLDSIRCELVIQDLIVSIYLGEFEKAEESLVSFNESECEEESQKFKIVFHTYKAYLFRVRSKYRRAIEEYKKVLSIATALNNKEHLVKIYYGIGGSHHRLEEIEMAIEYFNKAKRLTEGNNDFDSLLISNLYLSSGALYQEYGMWEEGLNDINIADKLQPNNSRTQIFVNKNKAIMYTELDSFEKAEFYYSQMMAASKTNQFMHADAKVGLALLYIKKSGFKDREENLLIDAYSEIEKSGNKKTQASIVYTLADEYLKLNEINEARKWVNYHDQLSEELNISKQEIKNKYLNLKLHHLKTGKSSQDIDEIALYADSIQRVLDNERIKKKEIKNRIKHMTDNPNYINNIDGGKYLIGSTLLLLFMFMYFFFNGKSKSKKTNNIGTQNKSINDKMIQRLKIEKQQLEEQNRLAKENKLQLEEQNELLVFEKSELEGLNKKLRNDIIEIKKKQSNGSKKIEIKSKGNVNYVSITNLLYIQAEENGCRYYLKDNASIWNDEKLKTWEDKLDPTFFVRIHRSTLVQKEYISMISYDKLSLVDGTELKIGRKYKENL